MFLLHLPDGRPIPERGAADALRAADPLTQELTRAPNRVSAGLVCVVAGKRRDHVCVVRHDGDLAECDVRGPGAAPRRWLVVPVVTLNRAITATTAATTGGIAPLVEPLVEPAVVAPIEGGGAPAP